jgi:predicted RNA binding protein YcfA (HicA-like mRNA interferase family)
LGRLSGISGRAAVAAFGRAGFVAVRQKGSHVVLVKKGRPNLVIPMHRCVAPFLLRCQIRRAGLTEADFIAMLT